MDIPRFLTDVDYSCEWLTPVGFSAPKRAQTNIVRIAGLGVSAEMLARFLPLLANLLRWAADPDMALNNLERYLVVQNSPVELVQQCVDDPIFLSTLLQVFSTSQYMSDVLIAEPERFVLMYSTENVPLDRNFLVAELTAEIHAATTETEIMRRIRSFKQRYLLLVAFRDIVRQQSIRLVTEQISIVADAVCESALRAAWRKLIAKYGEPKKNDGTAARFVVFALGKLGGQELNYWSDIDLLFLYDNEGKTSPNDTNTYGSATRTFRSVDNSQFFTELGREFIHYLTDVTEQGNVYHVDMRLRPHGQHGLLVMNMADTLHYYDTRGRTWERQALIKARPIAGDLTLGEEFLEKITPWIYRRYLTLADMSGIRTLKRKIEKRTTDQGENYRNVKTGHGGIRDIEFTIQFLQLLNGGDVPHLRTGNTLEAIAAMETVGCLSHQECDILTESYGFLRKIEHRLQILFAMQTHSLPQNPEEMRKLSLRMGYTDSPPVSALVAFSKDYIDKTRLNRKILNHLLHDAFPEDSAEADEVELILEPTPDTEKIHAVLGKYRFKDTQRAYRLLNDLAEERNQYLSDRRCRYFLAVIAPKLLAEIANTPAPEATLTTLSIVSESLGGKGVLWELFSFNPPSLHLYVRLCAYAPYLTDMLASDPGMLDGLMDSLVLDRLPRFEAMSETLHSLCLKAKDTEPILHGFKNDMQLWVGARDILGKDDIRDTTGCLSDIARICLQRISQQEYQKLVGQLGYPLRYDNDQICRFAIVGLGKLGGREMNYHSDLDVLFVYETDTPSNQYFFNTLAQKIVKRTLSFGAHGKLYEMDTRLRPMGQRGTLAMSLPNLERYFTEGTAEIWQRQTLCKARVVVTPDDVTGGVTDKVNSNINDDFGEVVMTTLRRCQFAKSWEPSWNREILAMRRRLREAAPEDTLKRGTGGMVDVEFIVQGRQLQYGYSMPQLMVSNTLDGLDRLYEAEILAEKDYHVLRDGYRFLRKIESCLRLINSPDTNRLPVESAAKLRLAFATGVENVDELETMVADTTHQIAACFGQWYPFQ